MKVSRIPIIENKFIWIIDNKSIWIASEFLENTSTGEECLRSTVLSLLP
jgi:hypothetical protein